MWHSLLRLSSSLFLGGILAAKHLCSDLGDRSEDGSVTLLSQYGILDEESELWLQEQRVAMGRSDFRP